MMWATTNTHQRIADFIGGDETALVNVYGCFAGGNSDLIGAAALALADRLEILSTGQRIRFLERMGEYTSLDWYDRWQEVDPARLRGGLDERCFFAVLAAGSAHPNGYYRERGAWGKSNRTFDRPQRRGAAASCIAGGLEKMGNRV